MIREWRNSSVIGMDVDADNVAWASANLVPGRFVHSPLMPPCPLNDGTVDAVFSVSVMTHLAPDVQQAWLNDLARIVRPDGIVLMSFGGPGAVAWSSVWNGPEYLDAFFRDGFHADQADHALRDQISDSSYYRNVAQTHEHVRREWAKYFEIVEILHEAIGNLDVAVLRRR
jgi:SAM-dependent methyltransferase